MSLDQICNAVCFVILEGLSGEETLERVMDVIVEAEFGDGGASLKQIESVLMEAASGADR